MKTVLGIQQQSEGLRRAAFLIHCSLVEKKGRVDINKVWPLPFDGEHQKQTSSFERLKQIQIELKQKQNAGRTA